MTAPDKIWHEIVTAKDMDELYGFGISPDDWNAANFEEYTRTSIAQSAVAAAYEAAAQVVLGSNLGLDISDIADDVRALATPDQNAALAAERAATVTVNPLVWAKHPSAYIWRCDTMIGTYKVFGGMPSWDFDSATDAKDKTSNTSTSAKLAKAAAQADYDARIRAAITITSGAAPAEIGGT